MGMAKPALWLSAARDALEMTRSGAMSALAAGFFPAEPLCSKPKQLKVSKGQSQPVMGAAALVTLYMVVGSRFGTRF